MARPVPAMSFLRQPLDRILSGPGSVRVLRALLRHGGYLAPPRIARETRMTPQGARHVLNDLGSTGVIETQEAGRTRLYRAAGTHPLVAALDRLFAAERERFDAILLALAQAAEDDRVAAAWLFGSVARGEDGRSSDLDLAVVLEMGDAEADAAAEEIRESLREPSERLGFRPSVVPMTQADLRRLVGGDAPLWRDLKRDAQVVKGPSPEAMERALAPPREDTSGTGAAR